MQWAREIAAAKPDLVRLQEAAEWRTQFPSDFSPTPDATTVAADFVNLLVGDLAALGVHYTVAAADTGYDVEAPGLFPFGFMDVRVTQHDVILARQESRLKASNPQAGQYQARITRPGRSPSPGPGRRSMRASAATRSASPPRISTRSQGRRRSRRRRSSSPPEGPARRRCRSSGRVNSDADATTVTGIVPDTATYQNIGRCWPQGHLGCRQSRRSRLHLLRGGEPR
jgi:hypothetical protein